MSDLFVDRLGNIVIADGVARLDFLRLSALDAERKQARMVPSARIAIPVSALLQAIDMLDKIRDDLLHQELRAALYGMPAAPRVHGYLAGVGGLNHFLLPKNNGGSDTHAGERYGDTAMEVLINGLLKRGARRGNLEAKVFGGARVLSGATMLAIGAPFGSRSQMPWMISRRPNIDRFRVNPSGPARRSNIGPR